VLQGKKKGIEIAGSRDAEMDEGNEEKKGRCQKDRKGEGKREQRSGKIRRKKAQVEGAQKLRSQNTQGIM